METLSLPWNLYRIRTNEERMSSSIRARFEFTIRVGLSFELGRTNPMAESDLPTQLLVFQDRQ